MSANPQLDAYSPRHFEPHDLVEYPEAKITVGAGYTVSELTPMRGRVIDCGHTHVAIRRLTDGAVVMVPSYQVDKVVPPLSVPK